jgi:putative NADH-flavin reductase
MAAQLSNHFRAFEFSYRLNNGLRRRKAERLKCVGSVSSLMQEAAVRLLDAASVSNPPQC